MPIIQDEEFGKITVRRTARATQVRLRVAPDGTLRASLPLYAPLFLVKRLLKTSRPQLRELLQHSQSATTYNDGMRIGKSHTLIVKAALQLKVSRQGQQLVVELPESKNMDDPDVIRAVRDGIVTALRVEAKSYLPKRLAYLATTHGFSYTKVRFSHASGRWGSCNSQGVISLNIALMKLPFELIDYVIVHELSHTVHMNHSKEFWRQVSVGDPSYAKHRRLLNQEVPSI